MKKIVAILLALLVLFPIVANGTKEAEVESGDEVIELRISWWGSQARHDATLKALDLYMSQNPNVKIIAEYQGFDGYHDKLITQISAGTEPDLYQLDNNVYFADLAMNDKLTDLTPYIADGTINLDDYPAEALSWAQYNGVQYGVPTGLNGPVLYYNKDIFDRAGVEYPTSDWTWEDLEEAGKKIHAYDSNLYILKEPPFFNLATMMRQNGGWIADSEGNLLDFSDALGKVFETVCRWREEGIVPPIELSSGQQSQNENLFLSGVCAIQIDHVATFPMQSAAVIGSPVCAVTMIPDTKTKGGVYMLASMPWTIGKSSKHQEEAAKLLNFLINDEEAGKILMTVRGVPGPEHIRQAITPYLTNVEQQVIDGVDGLVQLTTRIDYEWLLPGSSVIETIFDEESSNAAYGIKTPKQAGIDAYTRIKASVDKAK